MVANNHKSPTDCRLNRKINEFIHSVIHSVSDHTEFDRQNWRIICHRALKRQCETWQAKEAG